MSETSLKVTIAGRSYPLTVHVSEEPLIRQAEQSLEASIALFQKNYAVKDKQDLLAMAALQLVSRKQDPAALPKEVVIEKVVERVSPPSDLLPRLQSLDALLDSYLG